MTLTQLSYIIAVDTHRHFAKAAEQSFVSQPTLSMQIQKLEDELGVIIFDRSKQPIVPTEIGKKIIQQARIVVKESKRVDDIISEYSETVSGAFKVGIIPTVSPYLIPIFVQEFIKKYPDVSLIIDELQTDQILDALNKDIIDVGILATPLNAQGITEEPIYYEPFLAYFPKNHIMLSRDKISSDEIEPSEILLLDEGNCFREQTIQLCKRFANHQDFAGKHLQFEGGNLETLKRLVDNDLGVTVLPYLMVNDFHTEDERNRCKPFVEPVPKREISVIYGRSYLKRHIVKAFIREIRYAVPEELQKNESGVVLNF